MKIVWAITTFNKNAALRPIIESLLTHCDTQVFDSLVICDDGTEAKELYEEFKTFTSEKFPEGFPIFYRGGKRVGVAKNKNRGIRYFVEETEATHVILLDDDIVFTGPGLEKACLESEHLHLTGYLGDSNVFSVFPPFAESKHVFYCTGSQGMFLYATRKVVEDVGYFDSDWKGMYGYEHSIWTNRINRFYGYYHDRHPVLKGCERFFWSQQVPNTYEPDYIKDKKGNILKDEGGTPLFVNTKKFNERRIEVIHGIHLVVKNPGV